jgi:hypothetical protein
VIRRPRPFDVGAFHAALFVMIGADCPLFRPATCCAENEMVHSMMIFPPSSSRTKHKKFVRARQNFVSDKCLVPKTRAHAHLPWRTTTTVTSFTETAISCRIDVRVHYRFMTPHSPKILQAEKKTVAKNDLFFWKYFHLAVKKNAPE